MLGVVSPLLGDVVGSAILPRCVADKKSSLMTSCSAEGACCLGYRTLHMMKEFSDHDDWEVARFVSKVIERLAEHCHSESQGS